MALDQRKVVWFEGMMLDPHHMQQWDRYQQSTLNARIRAVARFDWGLTHLNIDKERLANGEFRLLQGSGVMPDGFIFDLPDHAPLPAPRNVQEAFPATQERLPVFLAIPAERRNGSNFTLNGHLNGRETRFSTESISVIDENTGVDERQIQTARPNFQLRLGTESLETYTTLQIAEIVREPGGSFVLSERFIPTCLTTSLSENLMAIVRRLLELLVTKRATMTERARSILAQRELSPADLTTIGLLNAVNTYIPLVNHQYGAAESHPETLYTTMLTLAGQLSVYVSHTDLNPRDYPPYDHTNLWACFDQLDAIVRKLLGGAAPRANYVQIPLVQQRENLYSAQVDEALLREAQLFLVARSDKMAEDQLVAELPHKLRIASPQTIDAVLQSVIRALPIEHATRLPAGMPVDGQANYFQLQKRGPFWEAIQDSRGLALFTPSDLDSLQIKLIAVQNP